MTGYDAAADAAYLTTPLFEREAAALSACERLWHVAQRGSAARDELKRLVAEAARRIDELPV